jgi:xylulokinase
LLEGVTHALRECRDLFNSTGLLTNKSRLSGGGANSPIWRQLCADLLGVPTATMTSNEGTGYGAALLAAVGAGAFDSVESACAQTVHEADVFQPGSDAKALEAAHEVYCSLYPALAPAFKAISKLDSMKAQP